MNATETTLVTITHRWVIEEIIDTRSRDDNARAIIGTQCAKKSRLNLLAVGGYVSPTNSNYWRRTR